MRLVHVIAGPAALVALVPVLAIHPASAAAVGLDQCTSHKVCFWSKPDFQGLPQFDDAEPSSDCASMDHVESTWFRDGSAGTVLELWHGPDCSGQQDAALSPGWKSDNFQVGSYKIETRAVASPTPMH